LAKVDVGSVVPDDYVKGIVVVDLTVIVISCVSGFLEYHCVVAAILRALVSHSVNVSVILCVEDYTVIVEVSSQSIVMSIICRSINVDLNRLLLEVSRSHDIEFSGILHWDHVSFSEMEMEIVSLRAESKVLSCFE
jgi:hypothetical protein